MFFKKKSASQTKLIHYEGLDGFGYDTSCTLELKDGSITFQKAKSDMTASFKVSQIKSVDFMDEITFLTQFHGNAMNAADPGEKFYWILNYLNDAGEAKYVALWGNGGHGFMQLIKDQIEQE